MLDSPLSGLCIKKTLNWLIFQHYPLIVMFLVCVCVFVCDGVGAVVLGKETTVSIRRGLSYPTLHSYSTCCGKSSPQTNRSHTQNSTASVNNTLQECSNRSYKDGD